MEKSSNINETATLKLVICPDCFGDGIETCHSPDHGFLSAIGGIVGANESACPCCGHSSDHKMTSYKNGKREYNKCYTCNATGKVTKIEYDAYLDEYVPEDDRVLVDEHCLS